MAKKPKSKKTNKRAPKKSVSPIRKGPVKKSTRAEITYRVGKVIEMLATGSGRSGIVRYASKEWRVSSRTADEYLAKAYAELKADTEITIEKARARIAARLNVGLKIALANRDPHAVVAIIREETRLLGAAKANENTDQQTMPAGIQIVIPNGKPNPD